MRFQQYDTRPQDYTIYLDLDGVLTDFIAEVNRIVIQKIRSHQDWENVKKTEWLKVAKEGSEFWSEMRWKRDGKELWEYVRHNKDVRILSAYPQAPENVQPALVGKSIWCDKNLGIDFDRVHLVAGRDKQRYAERDAILIDDSVRNCKQFINMGGKAIVHTSTRDTIRQLKHLYQI